MTAWRFYQGLRGEWRWYALDEVGHVRASSDRAFSELSACMQNAEHAGFSGGAYQVHTRAETTIPTADATCAPVAPTFDPAQPQAAPDAS